MNDISEYDYSDITPIEQDDGPNALATINYNKEYADASKLLRALMLEDEKSERALAVVEEVIEWNPAHYTAWEYRQRIINEKGSEIFPKEKWLVQNQPSVCENGEWLDEMTLNNTKNYQIWHYRQSIGTNNPAFYKGELVLIKLAIDEDSKNYHAWSHYKWLVQNRLELFPLQDQLAFINELLDKDVRNNSAWSFRYFLYSLDPEVLTDQGAFEAEREFVKAKIALAPQNESPWNYLVGLYGKYKGVRSGDLEKLCLQHTEPEIQSTHALEILQSIYSKSNPDKSKRILDILDEYIPTRKGYWNFLREKVA